MRSLPPVLVLLALVFGLAPACGGSSKEPAAAAGTGASSEAGGAQGGSASGGSGVGGSGDGGSGVASGDAAGGDAAGGDAAGGTAAGGTAAGGTAALVDCDPRKITCKRATPVCGAFEVPSVDGSCYGECVKVERCACSSAEQCPDNGQHTCWAKQHCGPYVD